MLVKIKIIEASDLYSLQKDVNDFLTIHNFESGEGWLLEGPAQFTQGTESMYPIAWQTLSRSIAG